MIGSALAPAGALRPRAAASTQKRALSGPSDARLRARPARAVPKALRAARVVALALRPHIHVSTSDRSVATVPDNLTQIRAYVRWEEAGKPQNTTPDWQKEEFQRAREDLLREILDGVTLNQIRRRYGQPAEPGGDEPYRPMTSSSPKPNIIQAVQQQQAPPAQQQQTAVQQAVQQLVQAAVQQAAPQQAQKPAPAPAAPPPPAETAPPPPPREQKPARFSEGSVSRKSWDLLELIVDEQESVGGDTELNAQTTVQRWARRPSTDVHGSSRRRIYRMGEKDELLVEVIEDEENDPEALSGRRTRVVRRQIVLTTEVMDPMILHWGVARDEPSQWLLPDKRLWPKGTSAVSPTAIETPFELFEGCMPPSDWGVQSGDDEVCYPLQRLVLDFPGDNNPVGEVMGVQFVLRTSEGRWFKDPSSGNFKALFGPQPEVVPMDELTERIVRVEGGNGWWSLMHRFNLASQLIGEALKAKRPASAMFKLFVWLRYSSGRHLTWQRNYNVKPRELASAQSGLGFLLANTYVKQPALREPVRLMLGTLGRGGDGGSGQAIRDEILNIMHRNGIGEDKGIWMEQWHQKLHNNTTPDDVAICEAYLAFLRGNMSIKEYWRVLQENNISKAHLASYERPIITEPLPRQGLKDALIKDFSKYLSILKSVHSGADLSESIRNFGTKSPVVKGWAEKARSAFAAGDISATMEAAVEARQELRSVLRSSSAETVRDALFLDLALDDLFRRAVESAGASQQLPVAQQMALSRLGLENLCLSTAGANWELVLCLLEWAAAEDLLRRNAPEWPLRAKAAIERTRLAMSSYADRLTALMQPAATAIGGCADVEGWVVKGFAENVIRSGPAFALSIMLTRLEPALRKATDMGVWQIISPVAAVGRVLNVDDLSTVQSEVFAEPTVVLAKKVGGDEEIPVGAVAVITPSMVDILSHSAVRARNMRTLFATCFDADALDRLRGLEGRMVSLNPTGGEVRITEATPEQEAAIAAAARAHRGGADGHGGAGGRPLRALSQAEWPGKFAVPLAAFKTGLCGAKSLNTKILRERLAAGEVPSWVGLPQSLAIPFGSFEAALADPENRSVAEELRRRVAAIDVSTQARADGSLQACREAVMKLRCPPMLKDQVIAEMEATGMPGIPREQHRWAKAWAAIVGVWASQWNVRAFLSCRNAGIRHDTLRMAVLCQRIVPADYAFVIHTTNPSTEDATELYAEVVAGLGEVLVGNYPGRAMSFSCKKAGELQPRLLGFPSKSVKLTVEPTFIFRSDSNGEDLEGFAGAGLYESLPMDHPAQSFVDYTAEPLVNDAKFREGILRKIAEVGIAVEKALGSAQDIEGVVMGGEVFVVQTRPQV